MIFKVRSGTIPLNIDPSRMIDAITSAVRAKAEAMTMEYKNRIVAIFYSSLTKRTGRIEEAIKPFVLTNSNIITLGFDFDLNIAPYIMSHVMMTPGESAYKVISSRGNMLTIPLEEKLYGKRAKDMNLSFIPTRNNIFLGHKTGSGNKFVPEFVLERTVKIPKRVRMYDIMDMFERDAKRELSIVAQEALNRSLRG
jgi:hypothetical protein